MTPFEYWANKEFNQFNWSQYALDIFGHGKAFICSAAKAKIYFKNGLYMKKYCTFSGKNGNSIFVVYSFFGVLCYKLKGFPSIARSWWWHKNHYMTTAFESLILINVRCVYLQCMFVFLLLFCKWVQPYGISLVRIGNAYCICSATREQATEIQHERK